MEFYGDYHTHSRRSDGRQSEEQIIVAALGLVVKDRVTATPPKKALIPYMIRTLRR